jgi:DNA-binding NtrC family response regulator
MSPVGTSLLVVDDDELLRETLADLFDSSGVGFQVADSGQAALRLYAQQPFELVLSDIRMPGVGGIELLGRIKAMHPSAVIVLMTAWGDVARDEAMRLGAADLIKKPFSFEELLERLAPFLRTPVKLA